MPVDSNFPLWNTDSHDLEAHPPPHGPSRLATSVALAGLWSRAISRAAALRLAPRWVGPRDHLLHLDRVPFQPRQPMSVFLRESLVEVGLPERAPDVGRYLRATLPAQSLWRLGKVMLEISCSPGSRSLGILMMGSRARMTETFLRYLAGEGVDAKAIRLMGALSGRFAPSSLTLARVEFSAEGETRYSIFPGWFHDFWRDHLGFERMLAGMDRDVLAPALATHLSRLTRLQTPELFPFCVGVSVTHNGACEMKAYTVRYDTHRDPLRPGSSVARLLEELPLSAPMLAEVRQCHERLWAASQDKLIQVCTGISPTRAAPERVCLLYCGTQLAPLMEDHVAHGGPLRAGGALFQRLLPVDHTQFLGVRVGPQGLDSKVKLYGHTLFPLDDTHALD